MKQRAADRMGWTRAGTTTGAVLLVLVAGCAAGNRAASGPGGTPKKIPVRFHVASSEARAGYQERKDEQGLPLFVAPEPFLTEADIRGASLMSSQDRHMVLLDFNGFGADRLERSTGENVGGRLAIFVDNELLMSPVIGDGITGGRAAISGDFTRERAARIVAGLNGGTPLHETTRK
jgi:preprotein translocase subunit SecD